ncbi:MAG: hypothetical protein V4724_40430 [Pseudomonadota bacterium]
MKALLKKIVRRMAGWPVVGRVIRIGVAVIRLPETNERQRVFADEQLPALLQTLSELNHRQLAADRDPDNLVASMPVTLRKINRELAELRLQLDHIEAKRQR